MRLASVARKARNNSDLPAAFARSAVAGWKGRRVWDTVEKYCVFVGYPRSGHSLVGALVDAHPDAAISHELDAMRYVQAGFRRSQLFALIVEKCRLDAGDRRSGRDAQTVPNQWQGRLHQLRVIGDKKGGGTARAIRREPGLLTRLAELTGLPLVAVHVTRHPLDNISAMSITGRYGATLRDAIDAYFAHCEGVATAKQMLGDAVVDLRHEDLVARPEATLHGLCEVLGLAAHKSYLEDCASVVSPSLRRSREKVDWEPPLLQRVDDRMRAYDFLATYAAGA